MTAQLKALAEKATSYESGEPIVQECVRNAARDELKRACSPDVILGLIAENERLRDEIERLTLESIQDCSRAFGESARADAAEAALAECRAHVARLQKWDESEPDSALANRPTAPTDSILAATIVYHTDGSQEIEYIRGQPEEPQA